MKKCIAVIGTHGAGKTTLSYLLAFNYKLENQSVKIVQECARSCPYPLNEGMSKEACMWIFNEQMRKELEAIRLHDVVICDRSTIDSFIYAKAQNCFDAEDAVMMNSFRSAEEHMKTYEQIIYMKSGNVKPVADGVRSDDLEFQKRVEEQFDLWIEDKLSTLPIKVISAEEFFNSLVFELGE